jgi:hypothetical protein
MHIFSKQWRSRGLRTAAYFSTNDKIRHLTIQKALLHISIDRLFLFTMNLCEFSEL